MAPSTKLNRIGSLMRRVCRFASAKLQLFFVFAKLFENFFISSAISGAISDVFLGHARYFGDLFGGVGVMI